MILERLVHLVDFFLAAQTRQLPPNELRKARATVIVSLVLCVVSPPLVLDWAASGIPAVVAATGSPVIVVPLVLYIARRTTAYRLAGHMLLVEMYVVFTSVLLFAGGANSGGVGDYVVLVLFAVLVRGSRTGWFWAIASVATLLATWQLTVGGVLDPAPMPPEEMMSSRLAESLACTIVAFLSALSFESTANGMRRELELEKERADTARDDVRLILNNTGQGFFTLDAGGRLCGEWSEVAEHWLGRPALGMEFAEYLAARDPRLGADFAVAWDQLTDGFMPLSICIDQLPSRFQRSGVHYTLTYRPILDPDDPERLVTMVVIVTDVTAEVERDQGRRRRQDNEALLAGLMHDPRGVDELVVEGTRMIVELPAADAVTSRRLVHTLKGNAASWGMSHFASQCHAAEDFLTANPGLRFSDVPERDALVASWGEAATTVRRFRPEHQDGVLIDEASYHWFLAALGNPGHDRDRLRAWAELWTLESARVRLERLAANARSLAERLGKSDVEVEVRDRGLRVDSEHLADLWAESVHLVRNAVDHGLPDRGGVLRLDLQPDGDCLLFSISDNGDGIDWEAVRARAGKVGLPAETRADLEAALFSDGLSTRDSTTITSGRGLGMGAVRVAVEALGGHIEIDSEPGRGTTFRLSIPRRVARYGRTRTLRLAG